MRTRKGPVSSQASFRSARCASRHALTPSDADGKTAIRPSPVILTTRPFARTTASRKIASWRSIAVCIASGKLSHNRVLDSRSVKTNVSASGEASPIMAPVRV